MNKKKQQELLITPSGWTLPEISFRAAHNAELDKAAIILLNARYKKVFLYEGNESFPQKSYTLFDHNMGLIDLVLEQELIQSVLQNPEEAPLMHQKFVSDVFPGILMHDSGEGAASEAMTALLKWSHPHLIPYAKELEGSTAAPLYGYALCSVLCNWEQDFLNRTQEIQNKFQKKRGHLNSNLFSNSTYEEKNFAAAVHEAISAIHTLYNNSLQYLSPQEQAQVKAMVDAHARQYDAIENPESSAHGTAEKFIKLVDKSCMSYNNHARASYAEAEPKTFLHERLSNSTTINDLIRVEKPVITYAEIKGDAVADHFAPAAYNIAFHRMSDYAITMRPVVFGKNDAPEEPLPHILRAEWIEQGYLPQIRLIHDNRQNGKHFLEDGAKSNLEMYALIKTKWATQEHMTRSIFDTSLTYSPQFKETAEKILEDARFENLLKRHFNNRLPK